MPILGKAYAQRARRRKRDRELPASSSSAAKSGRAPLPASVLPAARSAREDTSAVAALHAGDDDTSSDDDSLSSANDFDWRAAAREARKRREQPRSSGLAGSDAVLDALLAPRPATKAPAARDVAALSSDSASERSSPDGAAQSDRSITSDDPSPRKRRRGRRMRHALSSSDDEDEDDEGESDDLFFQPSTPSASRVAAGDALPPAGHLAASSADTPAGAALAAASRETPLTSAYAPRRWLMGPAAQSPLGAHERWAAAPQRPEQTVLSPSFPASITLPPRRRGAALRPLPMVLTLFGTTVARDEALTKHLPGLVASCGRALSGIEGLLLRTPARVADVTLARSRIDAVADGFELLLRWVELPPSPLRPTHSADQRALKTLLRPCLTSFAPIVSWAAGGALDRPRACALCDLEHAVLSFLLRLPIEADALSAWRNDVCLRQLLLALYHRPALLRLRGAAGSNADTSGAAVDPTGALGFWCATIALIHSHAQRDAGVHCARSQSASFWATLNALVVDNVATLPAALSCIGGRAGGSNAEHVGGGAVRADGLGGHVRFLWVLLLRVSELLRYVRDGESSGGVTTRFRDPSGGDRSSGVALQSNWRLVRVLIDAAGAHDDVTICYRRCSALASLWREPRDGPGAGDVEVVALGAVLSSLRERGALREGQRGGLAELRADAALHADLELQALL